jgi:hypothetical protein
MLRCASSFVIAAYRKVRLIPKDRERNPEAPLAGRRSAMEEYFLPYRDLPPGRRRVSRAPCLRPFYEAFPFSRLLRLLTRSSPFPRICSQKIPEPSNPLPLLRRRREKGSGELMIKGGGFYHSSKPRVKGDITNLPRGIPYHLPLARARNDLLCPGRFYIF